MTSRVLVYRRKPSEGAVALVNELRTRGVEAMKVRNLRRLRDDDLLVCWGEYVETEHPFVLNNVPVLDKYEELEALKAAEVPTVAFSEGYVEDWLRRSKYHSQARDLLNGVGRADYYVRRENFDREVRVHVWRGVSTRAGVKVPVPGETSHDWIRSRGAGWRISYCGVNAAERRLAKAAVNALGLTYGAVDIARVVAEVPEHSTGVPVDVRSEGGPYRVLEVNRAPGLDGRTIEVYADRIINELEAT